MPHITMTARAAALLLWLAACGAPADGTPDAGGSGGEQPAWKPDPIAFAPCTDDALKEWECGFITVPVDYANPVEFLQVRVSRKKALDPSRRIGVLLYNPGGPGSGGVDRLPPTYDELQQAQRRFDFIGFDPRGTGASEPDLTCLTDEEIDEFRTSDGSVDEAGAKAIATKLRAGCLRTAGSATRLASITTKNVARDMDSIRVALGEEKLNFVGASYGTWLGAVYATLFPTKTRAFVLDAGVFPDHPSGAKLVAQSTSIMTRLDEFFLWCATRRCALAPDGRIATAKEAFEGALSLVDRGEVDGGRRPLSTDDFFGFIVNALYAGTTIYSDISALIQAILEANDTPRILAIMDGRRGRNADGTYTDFTGTRHTAIVCADGLAEWTESQWSTDLAAMRRASPRVGVADLWSYYACLGWPVASDRATIDAKDAPPLLVLEGLLDPATPFEGTRALVAALGNGSHLYSYPRDGHVSYFRDAVRLRVQEFLEEPDAVTGSPVDCSDWVRPAATEHDVTIKATVGHQGTAVTVERRDPTTDEVLETTSVGASGARVVEFTVPQGTTDTHVLLHATGATFRPYRWYLDLHRLGQGLPQPLVVSLSESSITNAGAATRVGITQDPEKGFIYATFKDCDGLITGEFKLQLPGQVVYQGANNTCLFSSALTQQAKGCLVTYAYNVPPGSHSTGVEYGNASYPGPTILVDAGGMTEVNFTPESD